MVRFADPDLILDVVQETLADGRCTLAFVAKARDPKAGLCMAKFRSKPFREEPRDHFSHLIRELKARNHGDAEWLADRGIQLFEDLLPIELQRGLWKLTRSARTIHILSDEVWIPWELLRLRDPDDPASCGPFLVEAFSVTRWLSESPSPETTLFPMRRIALVVPSDSSLPYGSEEGRQIRKLRGASGEVLEIPAVLREVKQAMASGEYDAWHFSGHGVALGGNSHLLLDRGEELSPAALYGEARRMGTSKPLVFLNSCHSGRGTVSLTGMDGLASAFLKAGAGAFIGANWEIRDEQASWFAVQFYQALFSGIAIGAAIRHARLELRSRYPESNAWLAFAVFAHPLAHHSPPSAAPPAQTVRRRGASRPVPAIRTKRLQTTRQSVPPPCRTEIEVAEPGPPGAPVSGEERVHSDGTVLVYVPGGEIVLGTEDINPRSMPQRRVRLTPYWIGKYLITNQQYSRFLAASPSSREPASWDDSRLNQPLQPVVGVSWDEALAYCRWAGLKLPSEVQWEAAARGTDRRPYPWGRELPTPRHANFAGRMKGTTPVDAYAAGAGPYGTFDQAGNVWEWCVDPWVPRIYRQIEEGQWDPVAIGEPAVRSLRGGSWMNPAQDLRTAYRERGAASLRFNNQGFRCVWRPD